MFEDTKRKISIGMKSFYSIKENHPMYGKHHTEEARKKISDGNKGKKYSEETKKKMSESLKGRRAWNKGIPMSENQKIKLSEIMSKIKMGTKLSKETKEKISKALKGNKNLGNRWQDINFRNKTILAIKRGNSFRPNKKEIQILGILNELFPKDWKYTGNGKIKIEGKCPDFINVNGKKLIIEFNGDYWHRNDNSENRINLFNSYGYKTLILHEYELKEIDILKNKIKEFCIQ